jgi:uncharacterized protein
MNRVFLLALAFSLPLTARADDASRHAKAEELALVAHADRLGKQWIDALRQQTTEAVTAQAGGSLTPEQKAALDEFQKKLAAAAELQIGWKTVEPALADIYAKAFTEEQMDVIIAFYKTPAGSALLEKMPEINQQANLLMQSKLATLKTQVEQMFEDFVKNQLPATPPASTSPAASPAPKPAPPAAGPPK